MVYVGKKISTTISYMNVFWFFDKFTRIGGINLNANLVNISKRSSAWMVFLLG